MKKSNVKMNAFKIFVSASMLFTSSFVLVGCGSDTKDNTRNEEVSELTPEEQAYQKELASLKDYQVVDKTYPNEDLEPYNKMQGYVYIIDPGDDQREYIDVIPPTKDFLKKYSEEAECPVKFKCNIITPACFKYIDGQWRKYASESVGENDTIAFMGVDDKYMYATQEELTEIFGIEDEWTGKQFTLKK